jgi:hypothetical protein
LVSLHCSWQQGQRTEKHYHDPFGDALDRDAAAQSLAAVCTVTTTTSGCAAA